MSVYYLKPHIERWNIHPPEVLLFGDVHESYDNQCDDCEEEKGCYSIYSKSFLRIVDRLAQPIDFFVESSPIQIGWGARSGHGVLFDNFYEAVGGCYDVKSRVLPIYERVCPTRNIRWHYADSRFFDHSIEGYIIAATEGGSLRVNVWKVFAESKGFQINPRLLDQSKKVILQILGVLKQVDLIPDFAEDDEKNIVPRVDKILDQIGRLFIEACRSGKVGKQIRNMPVEWHKIFLLNGHMKRSIYRLKRYKREFDAFRKLVGYDFIGAQKSERELRAMIKEPEAYQECLNLVFNIFLDLNSHLLDLYLIGRMLKKPVGGVNSSLSLAYLGDHHVYFITKFLMEELGYSLWYDYRNEAVGDIRCVEFNEEFEIDLSQRGDLSGWNTREKRDRLFWKLVEEIELRGGGYPTSREIDAELGKLFKELSE